MRTRTGIRGIGVALFLLLLFGSPSTVVAEPLPDYTAIDRYVQAQMDANHFPGVAIAVVNGGSVAHAQGFGHDGQGQAVTPRTPFMIGSNSKSFTALAVMQLADAGLVDVDAPVQRYLPHFHVADATASAQITVRHLLNQRSGLPAAAAGDALLEFHDASLQQTLAELSGVKLNALPGTAYEYANANYMLLGMVVESVAHEPYASYIQRHILDKLQMRDTRLESGPAVGYRFWFGVPVPDSMPYRSDFASVPTGGVVSTAEDMSHYLAMYLKDGEYSGTRVASAAAIAEMERGVSDVTFTEGERTVRLAYGMGWATGKIGNTPAVYHTGGSPQFSSWMVLIPSQQRALITLTNANNWLPGPGVSTTELIPKGVVQLLAGETAEHGTSLGSMYLWVDLAAAVLAFILTWSLLQRIRHPLQRSDARLRAALPLAWEVGLPVGVVLGLPQLYEVHSWGHVMAYTPDLGAIALFAGAVWLLTAGVRVARLAHTTGSSGVVARVGAVPSPAIAPQHS
jgi:CubicO group peptidase (beta-lactamase class C family)